jgi:hypothetical protein
MVFLILNGTDWENMTIVQEDGENLGFDTEAEAKTFADNELNFKKIIIEV